MTTHKHQCGLITIDQFGHTSSLDDYGCGHVFEHDSSPSDSLSEKARKHKCPNCGTGPWYTPYKEATRRTLIAVVAALLTQGCASMRPLAEYQHISHATQHFGADKTNYGWNIVSGGIRWEPTEGVIVDLLEGYSVEPMNGRHEVFTGRITVEF